MGYEKKEKVQVKIEFLRMLIRTELAPARMTLLTGFFETYLKLDEKEEQELEDVIGTMDQKEAGKMIELTTSWEEKGKLKGQANIMLRMLKKRFGSMSIELENKISSLPDERLQELAEAIFDLEKIEDLQSFLG